MLKTILGCLVVGLLVSGCVAVNFSKTGNYQAESREANCDFTVYTLEPKEQYHEIGLIEFELYYGALPGEVSKVKKKASKQVCAQGGNGLLLWQANGAGRYSKATVIYVENQS